MIAGCAVLIWRLVSGPIDAANDFLADVAAEDYVAAAEHLDGSCFGPGEATPDAIRAFFGDAEAQKLAGLPPTPVFDQNDPDCWLRTLRKGGPETVLRAGLAVLAHLLDPWERWFPEETAPRQIHEALLRFLEGDAQGLAYAQSLVQTAQERASAARDADPPEPLPEGFRTYVYATNAAQAAARS